MLLYFLFVHKERNMWDQFSHLIVLVSVLHVVGTLGMLMALVKKSFSFWVETFSSIKENGFSALLSNL